MLFCLVVDGIALHGSVSVANQSLTIESMPRSIRCTVGRQVEIESIVSNRSNRNFRITELTVNYTHLNVQLLSGSFLLEKHEKRIVRTRIEARVPGRFEIQAVKVALASRANLFRQSIWAPDKAIVIARPTINSRLASIDSSFLEDLTSDRVRLGTGTDLAGVKPSTHLEDLHRVDWKSTARTGKLMVKEFYRERQPSVMLAVDFSRTMRTAGKARSVFSQLLATLPSLLTSFTPATPIGLTLYDEKSVITSIPAQIGRHQRELILDILLNRAGPETSSRADFKALNYASLKGTRAVSPIERHQYRKMFNPFLVRLYGMFRDAQLRHSQGMHRQGAFLALAQPAFSDSSLLIALTDGKTNLDGLIEGAMTATVSGHRVILILLIDVYHKIPMLYVLSGLRNVGIRLQECFPEELPTVIQAEISRMSRDRVISSNVM